VNELGTLAVARDDDFGGGASRSGLQVGLAFLKRVNDD
jgi:hypothetical protein